MDEPTPTRAKRHVSAPPEFDDIPSLEPREEEPATQRMDFPVEGSRGRSPAGAMIVAATFLWGMWALLHYGRAPTGPAAYVAVNDPAPSDRHVGAGSPYGGGGEDLPGVRGRSALGDSNVDPNPAGDPGLVGANGATQVEGAADSPGDTAGTNDTGAEIASDTTPDPMGELVDAAALPGADGMEAMNGRGTTSEVPLAPLKLPAPRSDWTSGLVLPTKVVYTVKRGGTLRDVANLHKIFPHEIEAWNPGTKIDAELGSGAKVVVWKAPESSDKRTTSESVGLPTAGSLEGGIPMTEGPGRVLKRIPWKGYGAAATVALVDGVSRKWSRLVPDQHLIVGNMSAAKGGKLPPHGSHQSGRDVDLGYPQKWDGKGELDWATMNAANLDVAKTWLLIGLFAETGAAEVFLVDSSLQKLLYDYAVKHGTVPKEDLGKWIEYPRRPGSANDALIRHVDGHTDHIHVRLRCPSTWSRCKSKSDDE